MRSLLLVLMAGAGILLIQACPADGPVKKDDGIQAVPDGGVQAAPEPEIEVVERPTFDPDRPPPCESHTACYLSAKEAHAAGTRAGYLLALERCEYYRGSYQLEKFYGLCLLILADAYRHLNNFEESRGCYQRFLDAQPGDQGLTLQAREGIEEVKAGEKEPRLYRRYLEAVALLTRYNVEAKPELIEKAEEVLTALQREQPGWALAEKVSFLLTQIAELRPPKP